MSSLSDKIVAHKFLRALEHIPCGTLTLVAPEGVTHVFQGKRSGPIATFVLHDWGVMRNAMLRGDIALGEDYIAGRWETDSIEALFSLFLINMDALEDFAHGDWFRRFGFVIYNRLIRRNSKRGSGQNIQAHYDVGNEFYQLWLDETMTYSSALFQGSSGNLVDGQRSKYNRILNKLGDNAASVLEIGCGWGGFAEQAATQSLNVTGLTVSPAQHAFAKERLGGNADIRLQDYRDTGGVYDAIVSIEMFEAVGERYWPTYFKTLGERLKKGGKAIVQTITIHDDLFKSYRSRSDFIRHYVFPGGMLPSLKRFQHEAAKSGLKCVDSFAFGHDYAETLRRWRRNFDAKHDQMLNMGYDQAFLRNWQFYLDICAATFAVNRTDVVQVELVHA